MPEIRQGSNPDFCPPSEEGMVFTFEDEKGDLQDMEFLGLLIYGDRRYGFFLPTDDNAPDAAVSVLILEVVDVDEEGQPCAFELVEDMAVAQEVFDAFHEATKDIYTFE